MEAQGERVYGGSGVEAPMGQDVPKPPEMTPAQNELEESRKTQRIQLEDLQRRIAFAETDLQAMRQLEAALVASLSANELQIDVMPTGARV